MLQVDELTKIMAALGQQGEKLRVAADDTKLRARKQHEAYRDAHQLIADALRKLAALL